MAIQKPLRFIAGKRAYERILTQGLQVDDLTCIAAAAGGPKWLILNQMDRWLFGEWLKTRSRPLPLIGASIGAWRMACAAQSDPIAAFDRFEQAYLAQTYSDKPDADEISREGERILQDILGADGVAEILTNPLFKLQVLANRCSGLAASENRVLQTLGFALVVAANAMNRTWMGRWLHRGLFHHPDHKLVFSADGFPYINTPLTPDNLQASLAASAAIPMLMRGVRDIADAPGVWRDGGLIDYHMDLPLPPQPGVVLLPHFSATVTTGWFDKYLKHRTPLFLEDTLVVCPSAAFIASLPNSKVPDRKDFVLYAGRDEQRIRDWQKVLDLTQALAEDMANVIQNNRLPERLERLDN